MTISNSHLAYTDCYNAMDKALEDEYGVRVELANSNMATFYRMRLNQARAIDRKRNEQVHEFGTPMHGISMYDKLVFRIREDGDRWWVYITKSDLETGRVESLSEIEGPRAISALDVPKLEAPKAEIIRRRV